VLTAYFSTSQTGEILIFLNYFPCGWINRTDFFDYRYKKFEKVLDKWLSKWYHFNMLKD